jgi:hypothetical protein
MMDVLPFKKILRDSCGIRIHTGKAVERKLLGEVSMEKTPYPRQQHQEAKESGPKRVQDARKVLQREIRTVTKSEGKTVRS